MLTVLKAITYVITNNQHGFVTGRSCLTNLLETLESCTRLLDAGLGIDVIYLDFRKASDRPTVPHSRVIEKLREYGITRQLLKWIEAFLDPGRPVNGLWSEEVLRIVLMFPVPQGSVLGHLLFTIFPELGQIKHQNVC